MTGWFYAFIELLRKELLQVLRDPKIGASVLVPPLLLLVVFGYGGVTVLRECPFAVLDRAHTALTETITAKLDASWYFERKRDFRNEEDLRRAIETKEVKMAVVFPPDFTRTSQLNLIVDGRAAVAAQKALMRAEEIVSSLSDGGNLRIVCRGWFNPNFEDVWFVPPAMLAILLLLGLMLIVSLITTQERETGTLDQIRITPYTPFEIMLAKGLCGVQIGIIQFVTSLVLVFGWFRVPYTGSVAALAAVGLGYITAAVGLGLMVSVWCRNLQQAMISTIVIIVPLELLSGMLTPVSCMPDILQTVMVANPARCAVDSLQRLFLEGAGLADVWGEALYLLGLGVVLFLFSWYGFKRNLR